MSPRFKKTKEEVFWNWFEKSESRLFQLETDQEAILDEISGALTACAEGLVFEISKENNGKREFIISADGLEELFPAVEKLAAAAPKLERWTIIAFRPRMDDYSGFKLNYAEKTFDPAEMWFRHFIEDRNFDLIVYYPDYNEDERNRFVAATYILLDMALGEYDVVTGIRYIEHELLPPNPEDEGLRPFRELRRIFDEYDAATFAEQ
ncbi:MAG TPA: hypothetical protein VFR80_13500 [Pyrinomonadaceae bacterium]|nr:hypothetical protein [Pyrinomonadaceae bacterium]